MRLTERIARRFDEGDFMLMMGNDKHKQKTIVAQMKVCKRNIGVQVDSGSYVNAISADMVGDDGLLPCDRGLSSWTEHNSNTIRKKAIDDYKCKKNDKQYSLECVIIKEKYLPILGRHACEFMNLITANYENIASINYDNVCHVSVSQHDAVLNDSGVGSLPGNVHLTVDENAIPVAIAKCISPKNLKPRVKKKLDEMVKMSIIAKVDVPTDWTSRMVVSVQKNVDRICVDPQALNAALKRELYPLSVIDDILPELNKARIFSKFDLRNGYWHCVLDEESSYLTTFQTDYGRYRLEQTAVWVSS